MKKILTALFILGVPTWASYQPVSGSSVTVFATQGGALPVSGTFFQGTQPISGNVTVIASTVGISGTVPVSGTFFQTLQQVYDNHPATMTVVGSTVGISGIIPVTVANSTISVTQNGGFNVTGSTVGINGTVPVSGTFFQATQPVTVANSTSAVNVLGTVPTTVSNSTMAVVQTTAFTIANSTIGVTGSFSATGSSVTVFTTQGGALSVTATNTGFNVNNTVPVSQSGIWSTANSTNAVIFPSAQPVTVANSTIGVVGTFAIGQSTFGMVNGGSVFSIGNSTIAISNSISVSGSSMTVFTTQGSPLSVNATNTGFSVTNTPPVSQSGLWSTANSTNAVIFPSAQPVTVANSTIAVVGTFAIGQSTFGMVNGGSVFTIGNSTIAISNSITASVANSTMAVVQSGGLAWTIANSTIAALSTQVGIWTIANSTIAVAPNVVIASTVGVVNGGTPFQIANSTIAISNSISVSGSSMTIFSTQGGALFTTVSNSTIAISPAQIQNSTISVVQNNPNWTIANSTIATLATQAGIWTIANSTIAVAPNVVIASTVGVVNGGVPFQVGNSTIAIVPAQVINSTTAVVQAGGLPWLVDNSSISVSGIAASSGTNVGNPVKIGAVVSTTTISPYLGQQIAELHANHNGNLIDQLDCPRENIVKSSLTITASTTEVPILSSGTAGVYNDLLMILIDNTSATADRIDIRSGGGPSSQAIDFAAYVPAGTTWGWSSPHPWPQTTYAANWTAQSGTSLTDIRIYAIYCKTY